MEEITISFNSLKFNLYEILNISSDSSENKIKKAFKNLILHFHPDKNNKAEEDIYQHIILANQILCNKVIRKKYDEYLLKSDMTFDELKKNFNKNKSDIDLPTKSDAKTKFDNKIIELTNKHISDFVEKDILTNYEQLKKDREIEIVIDKEAFKSISEFNNKFENKITNKNFGDQIIPVNEDMRLSTTNINDNYTSLDIAFDNLYIDGGGISTSKYTSLEAAFKIQSLDLNIKQVDIEDAIKDYKKNTEFLQQGAL